MMLALDAQPLPLRRDDSGTIRIADTRVTLETIIIAFNQGCSAEQIAHSFDSLDLADIYAVISYYLRNHKEVDAYIAEQDRIGQEYRRYFEAKFDPHGIRDRLLARKKERAGHSEQPRSQQGQ